MAEILERLAVDCSVVVKWKLIAEDYAREAEELYLKLPNNTTSVLTIAFT